MRWPPARSFGPFADRRLDLGRHLVRRCRRGQWGQRCRRVCRVARDVVLRDALGETVGELLVQLAQHDDALGRVARLAAVAHPGRCGDLDRFVQVVGVQHDQRVGTAELQDALLEVPPGFGRDGNARLLTAGERHALDARVGEDRRDLPARREHVHVGIRRHSGVPQHALDRHRRARADRRVLEQDRVAQHQVRRDEPGDLVAREVPRHHPQQRPDRLLRQHRLAAADRQGLVRQQLRTALAVVPEDVDDDADFAAALVDPLPHLQRHDRGELVGAFGEQLRRAQHDRGAVGDRPGPPGRVPAVHPVDRGADLLVGRVRDFVHQFARRRVGDRVHGGLLCPRNHSLLNTVYTM